MFYDDTNFTTKLPKLRSLYVSCWVNIPLRPFYLKLAKNFQIYLRMYDHPNDFTPNKHNGEVNLSASELKKLKKKQKKEKAKEALEAAAKQKQTNAKKV